MFINILIKFFYKNQDNSNINSYGELTIEMNNFLKKYT